MLQTPFPGTKPACKTAPSCIIHPAWSLQEQHLYFTSVCWRDRSFMKIISLRAAAAAAAAAEAAATDRACPAGAFTPEVIASESAEAAKILSACFNLQGSNEELALF